MVHRKTKAQAKLTKTCMLLSDVVRSLHLDERVTQTGFTIADQAASQGAFRGKAEMAIVAAVLYLSCKHCGFIKTIQEVCVELDQNKLEVGRIINEINRKVQDLQRMVATPEEIMEKYGGLLSIPVALRTTAAEVMKRARSVPGLEGLQNQTLAGSVLLLLTSVKRRSLYASMVMSDMGDMEMGLGYLGSAAGDGRGLYRDVLEAAGSKEATLRSVDDIAQVTLVSASALRKAHATLHAHREVLLPEKFCKSLQQSGYELLSPKDVVTEAR